MTGSRLMNRSAAVLAIVATWLAGISVGVAQTKPAVRIDHPLVFTDEPARVTMPVTDGATVEFNLRVLTRQGWHDAPDGSGTVQDGRLSIAPHGEGIHVAVLHLPGAGAFEVRFLAMDPPAQALEPTALRAALPTAAGKLLAGERVVMVAMGDSVTATGSFDELLAMMLSRATGNTRIEAVKRAHSGRSIDATVRHFSQGVEPLEPDIGLLMYGLNDQGAGGGLDVYLQQYEWVARRLRGLQADPVFLMPTPDLGDGDDPQYALRTVGFGAALQPLASRLDVPLVNTFTAIWGDGGSDLPSTRTRLGTLFPTHYSRSFTSLIETAGKGDTIHPNALGHLAMARAIYQRLARPVELEAGLGISGQTRWEAPGAVTRLRVENQGSDAWQGRVNVYPPPGGQIDGQVQVELDLAVGAVETLTMNWPELARPSDALKFPYNRDIAAGRAILPVLLTRGGSSEVRGVIAPVEPSVTFVRGRWTSDGGVVEIPLVDGQGRQVDAVRVQVASDADVERRSLVSDQAVASLAMIRFASALRGEAEVDGVLSEWVGQVWSPLGLASQAHWTRGPADHRAAPEDARLEFAVKAGQDRLYLALRGRGAAVNDAFQLFFDARDPAELGSMGPYYWLDATLLADGGVRLKRGETSPGAKGRSAETGRWGRAEEGAVVIELAVPYALFAAGGWPDSGDLGFSLIWAHREADDPSKVTRLMWSDDGHPWTPRGYGVVRLQQQADRGALPWVVRTR